MGALWPRINVSLQSVAQILLVIGLGVWLTARRNLDRKALAAVSGVNWHVLIPALMFSSIVGAVTPSGLLLLWPLMVLSVVHVVLGAVLALPLGWVARLPKDVWFFTVMSACLPNCGNLPWLFMPTIIRYYTPADQVTAQIQYSTGLTSVYTLVIMVITLVAPFLFKKPPETLVLPRAGSTASFSTQDEGVEEEGAGVHPQHHHHHHSTVPAAAGQQHGEDAGKPEQQQQQQQTGHSTPVGATAWVVPISPEFKHGTDGLELEPVDSSRTQTGQHAGVSHLLLQHCNDQQQQQHLTSACTDREHLQQLPPPVQLEEAHCTMGRQPSVGALGSFSFSSHRSSSFLLTHSRQLLGSFSRSFSRGVNKGLRRSASFVQLVWSFPTGWQPQRPAGPAAAAAHSSRPGDTAGHRPRWLQRLLSTWSAILAHPVVNLPMGATLLGLACAAVGPVRGLLVNELAPLHWLWLGLTWVGTAAAPLATMQIGAELMQSAPDVGSMHVPARVQWSANAIAIAVKLVMVPLINVVLLRVAGLSRLVPQADAVYQLLMLVEASVPAAVTLLVVCSRMYPDIRPLSSMLFWQYIASLFTLPAFLVWYLYMLEL